MKCCWKEGERRPKISWGNVIESDMKKLEINEKEAMGDIVK